MALPSPEWSNIATSQSLHAHLSIAAASLFLLCTFNGFQLKGGIDRFSLRHCFCSGKSTSSDCSTSFVKEHKHVNREALRMVNLVSIRAQPLFEPRLLLKSRPLLKNWPAHPQLLFKLRPLFEPSFTGTIHIHHNVY